MKTCLPFSKLLVLASFITSSALAQTYPALEFTSGAGNPTGSGSSVANQVITFQNNTNNPSGNTFAAYIPTITATFSLSNQQYALPTGHISTGTGLSFGTNINNSAVAATTANLFPAMNAISTPADAHFTSSTDVSAGTGIDVSANRAVGMFTSARALHNAGVSTNGRYYYGDITITFSHVVSNPILHVVGLGGTYGALGFTTELELATIGLTLSKKSGSAELNVTSDKILNSATSPAAVTGSGAATGSVQVTGLGFSTMTFRIYLRGNGAGSSWGGTNQHQGDLWLIGVSMSTNMMNSILPTELLSFSASEKNSKAVLNWSTATEKDLSHFVVQRSTDAKSFVDAGIVLAYGNTTEMKEYSFTDKVNPASSIVYYRLLMIDHDGKSQYSATKALHFTTNTKEISIVTYPNPVQSELRVVLPSAWLHKKVVYDIVDNSGKLILKKENSYANEVEQFNIQNLKPGLYIARVYCGSETAVQKIIKN